MANDTVYLTKLSLENAVYGIIQPLISPVAVVWANQKAPRPTAGYVSLNLLGMGLSQGDGLERIYQAGGQRYAVQRRRITLSIQGFGSVGCDAVHRIKSRIQLEASLLRQLDANIAFNEATDINDLNQLMDTKIELRNTMDVILSYTVSETDGNETIGEVVIENGVSGDTFTVEEPAAEEPEPIVPI